MHDQKTKHPNPEVRPAGVLLRAKAFSGGQPGMDWGRRVALGISSTSLTAGCSTENQHFVEEIIRR